MASTTATTRAICRTSCTRTMSTPCAAHQATAPAVPSTRSAGSSIPVNCADESLAGGTHQHRHAEVAEGLDVAQQREVVVEVLAEADPRVDAEAVAGHAGSHRRADARSEEVPHLGDDVHVRGVFLHRLGLALHVHQDEPRAGLAHQPEHLRVGARGDVVHDRGAGLERGPSHGPATGVDAHRCLGRLGADASRSPAPRGRSPPRPRPPRRPDGSIRRPRRGCRLRRPRAARRTSRRRRPRRTTRRR